MLTALIILSSSIAIGILLANNPATLSIWIILTATSITCALGFSITNWFGLVTFLIYIGGILVIFAYFVAIQPNQQLEINNISLITLLSTTTLLTLLNTINKPLLALQNSNELSPFLLLIPNSLILLLIIAIVLFLALIAVINISNINQGPLRPFSLT